MLASTFLHRHSSSAYRWSDVTSEVQELFASRSYVEAREEFWDVIMTFQLWIASNFHVDFPMVLTMRHHWKFERRRARWQRIFDDAGLTFSPRYLSSGGNYRKAWKVQAALNAARLEQC